jgi:hypothetical protein
MGRPKRGVAEVVASPETRTNAVVRRLEPVATPRPEPTGLVAARLESFDDDRREVRLEVGREVVTAALDAAVESAVIRTALARHERVIAQYEATGWVVLGTLRTAATPGVDEGDQFVIKARRISVSAAHELSFVTGAASLVMRAQGQVETFAENITARASSLHKIIGRMIRLN